MNFKRLYFQLNRIALKVFIVSFWLFAIYITAYILFTGMSIWDKLSFLGITYLALGIVYGFYRFLQYMFSE